MRHALAIFCLLIAGTGSALSADCPGNPGALGTSRTIVVDPKEHPLLGVLNYRESLPLNDREVVLTFDDGPLPPYSTHVLDVLAAECVKATFFMVGRMARGYPNLVKRTFLEGHTVANHSQNHPFTFHKMTVEQASHEIEDGFASIRTALGNPDGVSNFFRIPGLLRQDAVERHLSSKGYQTWSVDAVADDWTHISDKEIVRRAISRLEARGKGILLLHDIQPATSRGLPELLRELKVRGFKIVHVVEAAPNLPKTATLASQWIARAEKPSYWPQVALTTLAMPDPVLDVPSPINFGIADPSNAEGRDRNRRLPDVVLSPRGIRLVSLQPPVTLPAPAKENFRFTRVWQPRSAVKPTVKPAHKLALRKDVTTTSSVSTTATAAPSSAGAPKPKTIAAPKTVRDPNQPPRPPLPTGHQLQITRPAASI